MAPEARNDVDPRSTLTEKDVPSLDLVLGIARDMLAAQLSYVESLDTKAGFVLGSSTLITAAVLALRGPTPANVRWLGVVALAIFFAVAGCALVAYMIRTYWQAPYPSELKPYMWVNPVWTKGDILHEVLVAYEKNKLIVDNKANWLRYSLWCFGAEAAILAILALVGLFS